MGIRVLVMLAALSMVVAACGGGDDGSAEDTTSDTEAAETTTTAAEETTTTEAAATTTTVASGGGGGEGQIPESPGTVILSPYADEDITTGAVVVNWYRGTAGNRIAVYTGGGLTGAAQLLCPGNSLATATDFEFISNTPVDPGSCDGFTTDVARTQLCTGPVWIYETLIPNDAEGTLFASLEWRSDATQSGFAGLTSNVSTDVEVPEFEFGLASYDVPVSFTEEGLPAIGCTAPAP